MKKPNPYATMVSGVTIVGFAAILIRQADAPGTMTAFYRLAIGTAILALPFFIHIKKRSKPLPARGIWLAIVGGIFFALDMVFWATGIVMSGAAIPTIMVNTAPLWVGLGALFIFREKQNFVFWIGLFLSMAGSFIIMKEDLGDLTAIEYGGLFGSIAAVFYAGYYLVSQKGRDQLSTLAYFWITSFSATITLLIVNIILGYPFTGYSYSTYLYFVILGIAVQDLGWLLLNYSQGYLPASVLAPSLLGQPVFTAILAWILLAEVLTIWQIIGASVVLLGIFVVHRSRR
jgi:drug/metabolite transporter (DMT)-like permease